MTASRSVADIRRNGDEVLAKREMLRSVYQKTPSACACVREKAKAKTVMIECRLIKARVTFRFLYRDMTDEPTRPERSAILSLPARSQTELLEETGSDVWKVT